MNSINVDDFLLEIKTSFKKHFKEHFKEHKIEVLMKTPKSIKANIHLKEDLFIALRFNARNGRMDFALIQNNQRIFGYDNLKEWHYHPYGNPSEHIPCDKPTVDKIVFGIKEICEIVTDL